MKSILILLWLLWADSQALESKSKHDNSDQYDQITFAIFSPNGDIIFQSYVTFQDNQAIQTGEIVKQISSGKTMRYPDDKVYISGRIVPQENSYLYAVSKTIQNHRYWIKIANQSFIQLHQGSTPQDYTYVGSMLLVVYSSGYIGIYINNEHYQDDLETENKIYGIQGINGSKSEFMLASKNQSAETFVFEHLKVDDQFDIKSISIDKFDNPNITDIHSIKYSPLNRMYFVGDGPGIYFYDFDSKQLDYYSTRYRSLYSLQITTCGSLMTATTIGQGSEVIGLKNHKVVFQIYHDYLSVPPALDPKNGNIMLQGDFGDSFCEYDEYFIENDSSYSCQKCSQIIDSCQTCLRFKRSFKCSNCMPGYSLNGNVCTKCDSYCVKCKFQQSNSVCTKCQEGFTIINEGCQYEYCNDYFGLIIYLWVQSGILVIVILALCICYVCKSKNKSVKKSNLFLKQQKMKGQFLLAN